jgi:ABC-type microcin C transport system permease subunit YejE
MKEFLCFLGCVLWISKLLVLGILGIRFRVLHFGLGEISCSGAEEGFWFWFWISKLLVLGICFLVLIVMVLHNFL